MKKEQTFKFWELCRVTVKDGDNMNSKIGKMLVNSINQVGTVYKDSPKNLSNGFYCPKVSGCCYAYIPKPKKAKKG